MIDNKFLRDFFGMRSVPTQTPKPKAKPPINNYGRCGNYVLKDGRHVKVSVFKGVASEYVRIVDAEGEELYSGLADAIYHLKFCVREDLEAEYGRAILKYERYLESWKRRAPPREALL